MRKDRHGRSSQEPRFWRNSTPCGARAVSPPATPTWCVSTRRTARSAGSSSPTWRTARSAEIVRGERNSPGPAATPLEWKVYGHDRQRGLAAGLEAAGFEPDEEEQVLVLPVAEASSALFDTSGYDVRQVTDAAELDDYAEISRQIGRHNPDEERRQLARLLEEQPDVMSVHIAYAQGEPVSCGRVHFQAGSPFAELAGARTKTTHRRQGFFTARWLPAAAGRGARLRPAGHRCAAHLRTDPAQARLRGGHLHPAVPLRAGGTAFLKRLNPVTATLRPVSQP
ncbi:hypothetical protein LV779_12445 [Streptomyces thinghirensis]|nr:hypothetical protein [Streptomyces thinghirensis]